MTTTEVETLDLADLRAQLEIEGGRLLLSASNEEELPYVGYQPVSFEDELAAGLSPEARARLSDIKAAIGRIDDGSYGSCDTCQAPIEANELARHPWAVECTRCQRPLITPHGRFRARQQTRSLVA